MDEAELKPFLIFHFTFFILHSMKQSAGILAYNFNNQQLRVLLVHPGGPFYKNKDAGAWSIPKGEYEAGENPLTVAMREFEEETGNVIEAKEFIALAPVKIKSGKVITAFALEADFDNCFIASNNFEMEWPPRSGKMQTFPEVDKAEWFLITEAKEKINPGQIAMITELESRFAQLNRAVARHVN
ncbi:MAG: hydrolase [Segetibacter sp.]|nr:hydrolase [Segetibacter sp.]